MVEVADLPVDERSVLVCGEEPGTRGRLAMLLGRNGFVADTAVDGKDGLAKFEKKDYFLVITDIDMPGMTGLELLGAVKRLRRDVDVVMITGEVDLDHAIDAIRK